MQSIATQLAETLAAPAAEAATLALRGLTYADRATLLPALLHAVSNSGCWVHERKSLSLTSVELRLEVQLRAIVELYSALIASGLELTRASHFDLTGHCMLRKYSPLPTEIGRVLQVRLEITFLEDSELFTLKPREASRA